MKAVDLEKLETAFVTRVRKEEVARCWTNWRNRLIKNRTQRWTRDMSAREKDFAARREERLASTALEVCFVVFKVIWLIIGMERPYKRSDRWSNSRSTLLDENKETCSPVMAIFGDSETGIRSHRG